MTRAEARLVIVAALAEASGALNDPNLMPRLRHPEGDVALAELGLDSLDQVALSMEIEQRTGIDFDLAEISTVTTIGELAAYVAQRTGG